MQTATRRSSGLTSNGLQPDVHVPADAVCWTFHSGPKTPRPPHHGVSFCFCVECVAVSFLWGTSLSFVLFRVVVLVECKPVTPFTVDQYHQRFELGPSSWSSCSSAFVRRHTPAARHHEHAVLVFLTRDLTDSGNAHARSVQRAETALVGSA